LRHSGGDRRLWTSPTVTLYLDVELSKDNLPGTLQNTSLGAETPESRTSSSLSDSEWIPLPTNTQIYCKHYP
jgi:hypothetical protein